MFEIALRMDGRGCFPLSTTMSSLSADSQGLLGFALRQEARLERKGHIASASLPYPSRLSRSLNTCASAKGT